MKAFIAALAVCSGAAYAQPTAVCLNRNQAAAMVDQGSQQFQIELLADGALRVERLNQSQSFWLYRPTNRVSTATELLQQCRSRFNEFQQSRLGALLESLRHSNPLALVFFLSLASASQAEQACRALAVQARLYRLVATGTETDAFGDEIFMSEDKSFVFLENLRGLVFEACPYSRK